MSKILSFIPQTSDQQKHLKAGLEIFFFPPIQRTERPLNFGFAECLIQLGKSHPLLSTKSNKTLIIVH